MYGSIMGHMGHMRVKCGSNVCQLGRLWVNHGIYWSCGPCMGHVWVMYGSHDSYVGQNGSYWLYLSNGYCHTGQQFVIIIWVIYVIIMWVSHCMYGSFGSYMDQSWVIHGSYGLYVGKNMSSPKWVICGSTMVAYHLGHIGYMGGP
mgnify:CR=1 FL=1